MWRWWRPVAQPLRTVAELEARIIKLPHRGQTSSGAKPEHPFVGLWRFSMVALS